MWPSKVGELLRFIQFLVQVHIALVTQQLIELFSIRALGSIDLAVDLRRSGFDISTSDTLVFNIPLELRLELMSMRKAAYGMRLGKGGVSSEYLRRGK